MRETDILAALKTHFGTSYTGFPVSYPNEKFDEPKPYVVFQQIRLQRNGTLDRRVIDSQGRLILTVVAETDTGVTEWDSEADKIAELYPGGLRIPVTGGEVTVRAEPDVMDGINQDHDYRVRVIVDYNAESKE